MNNITLGDFLKEIRENRNLSLYKINIETGLSKGWIRDAENNRSVPTLKMLNILLNFYKLTEQEEHIFLELLVNTVLSRYLTEEQLKKIYIK